MSFNNPSPKDRFKPGVSGNPKGKPKGTLSLTTLLREKLNELAEGDDKHTYADLLVRKTLQKALKEGDTSMIKYCYDRLEGSPTQAVEVSGSDKGIIEISVQKSIDKIYGDES